MSSTLGGKAFVFAFVASGVAACTSFAQTREGKELTQRYDRVVARHAVAEPDALGPLAVDAERCANDPDGKEHGDAMLSTATGPMTAREVQARCAKIRADLQVRLDKGAECEARRFLVFTDVAGDGRWTDADFVPYQNDSTFQRAVCPDPAKASAAKGLDKVQAGIQKECGGEARVSFEGDWEPRKNPLGVVVRRERIVDCYVARKR